jgi:hydrogenase-4 component B
MNVDWLEGWWLAGVVGLPLLVALGLAPARWRGIAVRATPWAALPALVLALAGQTGTRLHLPWLVQHTVLELDHVGRVFLGFSSILWLASGWYARSYLDKDSIPARFHLLFLLAMAGNFALILAGDIPTFYAGFALMGLASVGLVLHRGDDAAARAGRVYLSLAMVGEVLIFTGFVFLVAVGGTTRIAELHQGEFSRVALWLLLVGFGIKAGALSLHFWLPLAHPAAPVPASAVLSGAMVKAGLLGWIRFLPLGEAALPESGFTLMAAGLGSAFLGTFVGVVQRNPKTVLAYSSVCQMGILTAGIGIGALQPEAWPDIQAAVLIYATHHALAKGSLFLGVGVAQAARGRWQVTAVRLGLLLPALALAGAPFTSGALAKVALKSNLVFLPAAWAQALSILLPLAVIGTTLKMIRFLWLTWPRRTASSSSDRAAGLWAPWLLLVGAVLVGVWLLPGALGWVPAKLSPQKLWLATWPLIVGAGLAALGAWLQRSFSADPARWLPAGDVGVFLEKLAARLSLLAPTASNGSHGHEPDEHDEHGIKDDSRWATRLAVTSAGLDGLEQRLRKGPVIGMLVLLLILLIIWLMSTAAR